jgi:hypothetical protein
VYAVGRFFVTMLALKSASIGVLTYTNHGNAAPLLFLCFSGFRDCRARWQLQLAEEGTHSLSSEKVLRRMTK